MKNPLASFNFSADNSRSISDKVAIMRYVNQVSRAALSLLLLAAVAGASFGFSSPAAAADAITVIPPRLEVPASPGDTVVEKIRVINQSTTEISYSTIIEDFKSGDEDGSVQYVDESEESDSFRMAKWISIEPSRFTIAANSERIIQVAIKVPKNAEPGGHFASVIVRRSGTETAGGASVETRIGTLILMRVSGNVTEGLSVESFGPQETYAQYGPAKFDLRLKNDGNVHLAPRGTIVINNMFGKKVAEIPLSNPNVLPGAIRKSTTEWAEKNLIGRYTATLVAQYGQTSSTGEQKTLSATTSFIVFPLYLIWVTLGIIVVAYLLITQRKALRRAINRITSD